MGFLSLTGFTLVELLIVIGILAALSVVAVTILNPAELLKRARDSNRLSDMATLNTSLQVFETEVHGGFMGTSSVLYVSLKDPAATSSQGTDCASLGLPSLPSGWQYHCAASSTLRNTNGQGWVPVNFTQIPAGAPLSVLPVDPINTTSSGNYYSYVGGSFMIKTRLESTKYIAVAAADGGYVHNAYEKGNNLSLAPIVFPDNWIKVPGSGTYGTPDFWVMKYEAKCAAASSPAIGLTSPDTGYQTYANNTTPCTAANSRYVASIASGYPIANISHDTAKSYCQGLGARLMTNQEWMTIARNAEQVSSNWSGSSPGSGYLYSGHNDNTPANALQASTNDADGYYGTNNSSGNQRRTLTLSNGSVIWDIPGNVWEHVMRDSADTQTTMSLPACSNSYAGWQWCQYGTALTPYISSWTSDVPQLQAAPSDPNWNSSQGVGQVYTYGTGGNQGTTVFLRGGSRYYGAYAGAFTLYLNWGAGGTYNDVGFRCAR